jgi:hypothetical protein
VVKDPGSVYAVLSEFGINVYDPTSDFCASNMFCVTRYPEGMGTRIGIDIER